jgi:short-subunit dehydrogenase
VAATLPQVTARRGYFLLVSSAAAFAALPGMAAYCAAKAGVEQFGNALRLEVAHLGVRVGTAHPVWVDTDMVRDAKADLPTFRAALGRLPWPLNTNVPVRQCAAAFVAGIQRRRRRIYVPGPVWLVQALRTVILSPLGDAVLRRSARRSVPQMEADVRAAGRTFGEHSVESLTGRGRQPGEEANV